MIEFTVNEKLKGTKIGQWLLMAFREEKKRVARETRNQDNVVSDTKIFKEEKSGQML